MIQIDQFLFYVLHDLAGHGSAGDFLIVFFGEYFLYPALFVFAYAAYRKWQKENRTGIYPYILAGAAAIIARFGIASFVRLFYHRPRPFLALSLSHLITDTTY